MEKSCLTCCWNDEYYGDCVHPKSDGALGITKALEGCYHKGFAWWEPHKKGISTCQE